MPGNKVEKNPFLMLNELSEVRPSHTNPARDPSVMDLVDERFRQKELLAVKDIEYEFSAKLKRAEATLERRMQEMISNMSELEKKEILGTDNLHEIEKHLDKQLASLDSLSSDYVCGLELPSVCSSDGSRQTSGLLGVLSEAEDDIHVFGEMTSVSRESRAFPDQEHNSRNLDSASAKLDKLIEEQLDEILSGLKNIDFNPVMHVESVMEYNPLQSLRGSIQIPTRMRFVPESGDEMEKEISRLRELIRKLSTPAPIDDIINDEIGATDIKYLKLIAKLSGLIFDTYACGDVDQVDPVIHNQVLPFILGGPKNHLQEAVSQAIDQYLSERQSEKGINRLVQLEFSRMSRYRRYPEFKIWYGISDKKYFSSSEAMLALLLIPVALCSVAGKFPDSLRFPRAGRSIIPVRNAKYNLVEFLDFGSSTRVFLARLVPQWTEAPYDQTYQVPSIPGKVAEGQVLPDEVVIKFISSASSRLLHSIENEFDVYLKLNAVTTVRKPLGFYLSPRWRCNLVGTHMCQYIVMTRSTRDIERLIGKNFFKLEAPKLDGLPTPQLPDGLHSFEIFVASFMLNLHDELVKLHAAGFAHGDVRSCNIAVDHETHEHIFLIDVGAAFILSELADNLERKRRIDHDLGQLPSFLQKLVRQWVRKVYRDRALAHLSPLFRLGVQLDGNAPALRETLLGFLSERGVIYEGKLITREI